MGSIRRLALGVGLALAAAPAHAQVGALHDAFWSAAHRWLPLILAILAVFAVFDLGASLFLRMLRGMSDKQMRRRRRRGYY